MPLSGDAARSFSDQAAQAAASGSPFTADLVARLTRLIDAGGDLGAILQAGRAGEAGAAFRLCAGLHALVRGGEVPDLAAHYPPAAPGPGYDAALALALARHGPALVAALHTPAPGIEVARSGILIGGLLTIAAETGLPLELWEIGAGAGVNLFPDVWAYEFGRGRRWGPANAPLVIACDWRGPPPPLGARLPVAGRQGADAAPLDAADPAARAAILAHIWPDRPDRLAVAEAALLHAARHGPPPGALGAPLVILADAADWVADQLARPAGPGVARVLMHALMWPSLPLAAAQRISAALATAGRAASRAAPLAWLRVEADGTPGSAAIQLTLWPRGDTRTLGRGDFHGRWADWSPPP